MPGPFIVLGGTGHVGSVVALTLLDHGHQVLVVSRDPSKASNFKRAGATVVAVDICDTDALRNVFRQGERLFLLNPPAPPATDTDAEERKTVRSIVAALEGSGLRKIVAQSTYGAQPGAHLGDLGVLFELEQSLAARPIPATIMRVAYLMSNWDQGIASAREQGVVPSMLPADFTLPMVAPQDAGCFAAELLMEPETATGTFYIEGPERYSAADVADALASLLARPVQAHAAPRSEWVETFTSLGFSKEAARSYANMTGATLDGSFPPRAEVRTGQTDLKTYFAPLVGNSP